MENRFLHKINQPTDIRELSFTDLKVLADEIRQQIMQVLSINGGHLSSNLGSVELTIALHYVFSSPRDRFIFDVSHQTYTHKIITGRKDRFHTIRKTDGLSGFSDPEESIHDHFYAGHAGTALSLALGSAKARDQLEQDNHIIPILGDASLTCGLTLEALNNIPKHLSKFLVLLNDNEMSISENVGHIKHIMSRLLNNPTSNKLYHEVQQMVAKVPGYGHQLARQGQKFTESLKHLVSPAAFFEQFGLTYVGPIDGHDIQKLIRTFQAIKEAKRPIIVHIMTTKGKGMPVAIQNPTPYHGVKPFDLKTGKFLPRKSDLVPFPKIFGKHIEKMAEKNPNILAITPATAAGSSLEDFMTKFPDQCIDVGIAEGHAVTYAGGIASEKKLTVFAVIYATFLQRGLDNLFHDVCLQKIPLIFALDRSFLSAADGPTHHGIYDIAFLNAMPNMVICQPRNGQILKELMESAPSYQRPTAIRYPNLPTTDSPSIKQRALGKGEILTQGKDLLIVTLGHMCTTAFEVKQLLIEEELYPTIVDPIFIKPLDEELLTHLLTTHSFVVTIEEHAVSSGLGSILNGFIIRKELQGLHIMNIGIEDQFIPHGSRADVCHKAGLDPISIATKIKKKLGCSVS
jgi:1-deoxy-D-xylulose-5-phosphate synthase